MLKLLLILWAMVMIQPGSSDAAPIVKAIAPNGRAVVLHDTECPKSTPESKRGLVELLAPTGERLFAGCYAFNRTDNTVEIDWDDGDTSVIPMSVLSPKKPTALTT